MSRTFEVTVETAMTITVHDESVIDRCVDNHNDEGVPVPPGTNGWRDSFYDLINADDVIQMIAYNAVVNGIENVSRLDGWGDVADNAVTFEIDGRPYISTYEVAR